MTEATETLREALDRAAADLQAERGPPRLPVAARDALRERRRVERRRPVWAGAAVAATMLVGAVAVLLSAPPEADPPAAAATAFIPVAAADRWPVPLPGSGGGAPAWVVPAELPRASLAMLGLPLDPTRAGQTVRAELLVHASGDVLAVRFVR